MTRRAHASDLSPKVRCKHCGGAAKLVTGAVVYPHRRDLHGMRFWRCVPCDARVGCHKGGSGTQPLGELASPQERMARMRAHAAFDPLWKSGRMKRGDAYAGLADRLGMPRSSVHIGAFDVATCERVVRIAAEMGSP